MLGAQVLSLFGELGSCILCGMAKNKLFFLKKYSRVCLDNPAHCSHHLLILFLYRQVEIDSAACGLCFREVRAPKLFWNKEVAWGLAGRDPWGGRDPMSFGQGIESA